MPGERVRLLDDPQRVARPLHASRSGRAAPRAASPAARGGRCVVVERDARRLLGAGDDLDPLVDEQAGDRVRRAVRRRASRRRARSARRGPTRRGRAASPTQRSPTGAAELTDVQGAGGALGVDGADGVRVAEGGVERTRWTPRTGAARREPRPRALLPSLRRARRPPRTAPCTITSGVERREHGERLAEDGFQPAARVGGGKAVERRRGGAAARRGRRRPDRWRPWRARALAPSRPRRRSPGVSRTVAGAAPATRTRRPRSSAFADRLRSVEVRTATQCRRRARQRAASAVARSRCQVGGRRPCRDRAARGGVEVRSARAAAAAPDRVAELPGRSRASRRARTSFSSQSGWRS